MWKLVRSLQRSIKEIPVRRIRSIVVSVLAFMLTVHRLTELVEADRPTAMSMAPDAPVVEKS